MKLFNLEMVSDEKNQEDGRHELKLRKRRNKGNLTKLRKGTTKKRKNQF